MTLTDIKAYCNNPKNRSTVNVGLFFLLIISFHFLYLGWQALGYWPVGKAVDKLMVWSVDLVYSQSCWVLDRVLHIDITTVSAKRLIATPNVVRICGVLLMQVPFPNSFHLAHDYIFKVFFYLIIFLMWMLWVEKFYNPTLKNKQHE